MSADNVIPLPVPVGWPRPSGWPPQRLARKAPCRAQELADIAAALSALCNDDKRMLAYLLADDLGFDLVPARRDLPRAE